jgi:DNA-binding NarL/FixJ family response regulator
MLYRIVRDYEVHPLFVFGIGRGVYELALSAGLLAFSVTDAPELIASMSITTFYFVMTCVLLLLLNSLSRITAMIRRTPPTEEVAVQNDSLDKRFAAAAQRYGLSERETEVMRLLCYGRTKRYIAETLYLSEDTVRWHAKQLYRKMGVHSKQELIDLVGIE